LNELHNSHRATYTIKYEGIGLILVHHTFGWRIYTLNGACITDKFPNHINWLNQSHFDVGTMLKAEGVIFNRDNQWAVDFESMKGRFISTTCTSSTRALVDSGSLKEPSIVVYDVLYLDGESLSSVSYDARYNSLEGLPAGRYGCGLFSKAEQVNISPETWIATQGEYQIEGFVVVDGQSELGPNMICYSGDPSRPQGCYKLKVEYEEDVVAYAARVVNGKPESVFIKQRYPRIDPGSGDAHPMASQWFSCGRVSLHRNPELQVRILELIAAGEIIEVPDNKSGHALSLDNEDGVTITITCFGREPSGKFTHGKFVKPHRFRNDPHSVNYKAPGECFAGIL